MKYLLIIEKKYSPGCLLSLGEYKCIFQYSILGYTVQLLSGGLNV